MNQILPKNDRRVGCRECPLNLNPCFRSFTAEELAFMEDFKTGEILVGAGSTILSEGHLSPNLYTVLSGWAFRYKTLEDGRRQVLNYLLPGDLIGLQGTVMGEMEHSVEALTSITLCVFPRDRLMELYAKHPTLGFDVTWLSSREERMLDEHLLSLGRRSALERAAYLLAFLHARAGTTIYPSNSTNYIPITQTHVADTLGLSIVHTNKTIKRLMERGAIRWLGGACEVLDAEKLSKIAGWHGLDERVRPLL
ncbi:Crp/Fnr family transcriptional regulator [Devosia pacifica]|uniref:Crp/Fnr family transcriptional regulator n=1 Tax=Devosia pacifica TaxID=1335967 RepID=A0A918RZ67_9HYPH|nr:Crp/Fnr family transcriptional regulator [Devosia pacifica]GHA17919.1 Crp/Fnr family transcriptional regulator [Devosia pacifica]